MSHVTRTTVDLGDQPDLAVIYLGVRRRTLRGCEPVLDRERDRAGRCRRARRAPPTRHAVILADPTARRHAPVLARLRRARALGPLAPAQAMGAGSCATPPAPASGTRPTSCAAASRRSTLTPRLRWDYSPSPPHDRRPGPSSPLADAHGSEATNPSSPKQNSREATHQRSRSRPPPAHSPGFRQKQVEARALPAHALVRSVHGLAFAADDARESGRPIGGVPKLL